MAAARNCRAQESLALPALPPAVCGGSRGLRVGPATRTRGRKRATVVEENEDIAEGNNNAYNDQEANIQQMMEELAQNQEAKAALRAQIAAEE